VANSYDVIVLDLMLPGMDGLDLCRKLRADCEKSTPVLMLTARDTLEDKLIGLDAGADDIWSSPLISVNWKRACVRSSGATAVRSVRSCSASAIWCSTTATLHLTRRPGADGVADRTQAARHPHARIAACGQPARHRTRSMGRSAAGFGYTAQSFV